MQMEKSETQQMSVEELRKIDPTKIQYIHLKDGSLVVINNNVSSEGQSIPTGIPLFTEIKDEATINKYSYQPKVTTSKNKPQCRCHNHIQQNQNNQFYQTNLTQHPLDYSQTESYENYQYYQQTQNEDMNNKVQSDGQQNLKNNGPLVNDMVSYNEQQGMNYAQYYNSGDEGFVETEENGQNQNDYSQQQNDNYYVNPQAYEQNVEGEMKEDYYQPEEGYQQGYEYQQNQEYNQGYGYEPNPQEQVGQGNENPQEEINTDLPKQTVEEIVSKDDNEEKKEEEKIIEDKNENEEEKEEKNIIENQEDNKNPLPEVNEMISGNENENIDENKDQKNEQKEETEKNEGQEKEETMNNIENNNINKEEEPKKEGYYYVQEGENYTQGEQPQNQEKDINTQNQEEFKENEYKGEEEAEQKKEEIPQKREEINPNIPRPGIPVTRIEYIEYSLPKRTIRPLFPRIPYQLLLQEEARFDRERAHSHTHIPHRRFGRDIFPPFSPKPIPLFRPRNVIPMRVMRDFVPPRPIHIPHIHRPRFIQPLIRPVTGYMPPETYSFQYPYRPPQPVRFYERYERPLFTNIHPYSYLNQSYVYPRTNRRFEEFNENYEPAEMNRTNYFVKRNFVSPQKNDLRFNQESFYTYGVGRPKNQNRSVSNTKTDGRFATFSYGVNKPKPMFKRVENRITSRVTGKERYNVQNTSKRGNTGVYQ